MSKGSVPNVIKLRTVSVKKVVIVANAAIHCEVFISLKLHTSLRWYDDLLNLMTLEASPLSLSGKCQITKPN